MTNEELNKLSYLIENEIHATHSISDKLWSMIKSTVEANPFIKRPLTTSDKYMCSVMDLNPLSFKMFQYMVSMLDHVLPEATNETTYHVSNVVLTKAFKYFPNNTEIFIAYAIRRILNDRDEFVKECFDDKILNCANKSTLAGNLLAWLMVVVVVAALVLMYAGMERRKRINAVFYNPYNGNTLEKQRKKQLKREMKQLKNKLKSKYNI